MKTYHDLLNLVLAEGERKPSRPGIHTLSRHGAHAEYDLRAGFPCLTTKRIFWKGVVRELQWFLRGETNIRPLLEVGVSIWSEWAHQAYVRATGDNLDIKEFEARILGDAGFAAKWGDLGPIYGKQWRFWEGRDGAVHDQVAEVVRQLREDRFDRGIIVSGWNAAELKKMALRPCHTLYQWLVGGDGRSLDCHLYQRSGDLFLGVPFNMASAALWTHMLARVADLEPRALAHSFGDLHIYENHLDQVRLQLTREPRPLPTLRLDPGLRTIDDFAHAPMAAFKLDGYDPWPNIPATVAV